jgi:hypothetical protein
MGNEQRYEDERIARFERNVSIGGWIVAAPLFIAIALIFLGGDGGGHVAGAPSGTITQLRSLYFVIGYWPIGLIGVGFGIYGAIMHDRASRKNRPKGPPYAD